MTETLRSVPAAAGTGRDLSDVDLLKSMPAIISDLVLARAQSLAYDGKRKAAEDLLRSSLDSARSAPRALDLLARIRAQQGRYADAAELWGRVIQFDPSNAEARNARGTALRMTRLRHAIRPSVALVVTVALLTTLGYGTYSWASGERGSGVVRAKTRPPVGLVAREPAFGQVASWNQEKTADGIWLVPENSLFGAGTSLTRAGRDALEAIANKIDGLQNIEVAILGTSDAVPLRAGSRYRNSQELEISRAHLVADYLTTRVSSAPSVVVIRQGWMSPDSTGPRQPPGYRLRGVVLRIRRAIVE
jgi:tetratricopeptide (TPR) repeat protein